MLRGKKGKKAQILDKQGREFSHLKTSETGKTYGKEGRQETHRERKGDKESTLK
jgi:hypothetical protein